MQESRRNESEATTRKGVTGRQSEATSKSTIEDLAEQEKNTRNESGDGDSKVPAPDGQFDDEREDDPAGPI